MAEPRGRGRHQPGDCPPLPPDRRQSPWQAASMRLRLGRCSGTTLLGAPKQRPLCAQQGRWPGPRTPRPRRLHPWAAEQQQPWGCQRSSPPLSRRPSLPSHPFLHPTRPIPLSLRCPQRGKRGAADDKLRELLAALKARGCKEELVADETLLQDGQVGEGPFSWPASSPLSGLLPQLLPRACSHMPCPSPAAAAATARRPPQAITSRHVPSRSRRWTSCQRLHRATRRARQPPRCAPPTAGRRAPRPRLWTAWRASLRSATR